VVVVVVVVVPGAFGGGRGVGGGRSRGGVGGGLVGVSGGGGGVLKPRPWRYWPRRRLPGAFWFEEASADVSAFGPQAASDRAETATPAIRIERKILVVIGDFPCDCLSGDCGPNGDRVTKVTEHQFGGRRKTIVHGSVIGP
jgi:hypothetical protein